MVDSVRTCSLIFIDAESSSKVHVYLRYIPVERLPADYELLFINADQPQNELAYSETFNAEIRYIELGDSLGFEQLCIEAAKQASGKYILFAHALIDYQQVATAVQQLEISGMNIEASPEGKYIIVKADAFMQARGFGRLSQQQREVRNRQLIDQLIKIVTDSATNIEGIFFAANRNRPLLENLIKQIDLTRKDDGNVYKLLFAKSLKGYLESGLEFKSVEQGANFYCNIRLEKVTEIPWFVGILLSVPHLNDVPGLARHNPTDRQQAAAILVSVYNETRLTELCFKAVRKFTNFPYRLIAINNSVIDMQDFKRSILQQGLIDEWFDSGCVSHAGGLQKSLPGVRKFRYIVTLDSDAIVLKKGWLGEFVNRLNRENAGLIGPQTFPDKNSSIKGYAIHPSCMLIEQERIDSRFEINFGGQWPFDVGHLLTWDCLAHGIPIVKVSHEIDVSYTTGSSLINGSVRHFWYSSRIFGLKDDVLIDGCKVGLIRNKLDKAYNSAELSQIRDYYIPGRPQAIGSDQENIFYTV